MMSRYNACVPRSRAFVKAALRSDLVVQACALIETSAHEPDLQALACAAKMSPSHFHRVFKAETGVTPKAYAMAFRAKRMRRELARGAEAAEVSAEASHSAVTVTAAMYKAGFNSSGRFYETSPSVLGMTPSVFKNGGKGMTIRFAVGECSLGAILVAATDIGICAITLHDDPEFLLRDLQNRFRHATFIGADREFEKLVATVVGFVEQPSLGLDLPLDIRGTAFQQRVWQALRQIPLGTTASYADIAKQIGHPKAVRAVAQACGANNIAVAIPCHRVVRTDGSLSGYRWGVQRKAKLLERERKKES